jgi:hypothetical protein
VGANVKSISFIFAPRLFIPTRFVALIVAAADDVVTVAVVVDVENSDDVVICRRWKVDL